MGSEAAYLSHHAIVVVTIVLIIGVDGGGGTPHPLPLSAWNPLLSSPYNMNVRALEIGCSSARLRR